MGDPNASPEPLDIVDRLLAVGLPGGPPLPEALRLFAHLRMSPEEGRVIALLLARETSAPLPEPLLVAVASALVDRGENDAAARALACAKSAAALMLRADVLACGGDVPTAMALVERVLLRDIDWPGARERHARWRAALGQGPLPRKPGDWETIVTNEVAGPFRLLREVGRGGAGTVYEAEDRDLGRRLAIKVYHRPDRDRAQLLHEGRVAVALSGNGIVRVFDMDAEHGWLALEWAQLGSLRASLRNDNVSILAPMDRWVRALAQGLARVHAAGWVHHDVKPANVLMRSPDAPILSDFGTARLAGDPSPPGSLGYESPERLGGRASDPRDDVYGFGRVLQDALEVVPNASAAWHELAARCTGPDETRPRDGRDLVSSLVRL
jgi:serine/threonine-protein kinase